MTAPAIHALLSLFSPSFALLAVVVAAAMVEVGEEPGVAVVVGWESISIPISYHSSSFEIRVLPVVVVAGAVERKMV